jgi:hypothetical protein
MEPTGWMRQRGCRVEGADKTGVSTDVANGSKKVDRADRATGRWGVR